MKHNYFFLLIGVVIVSCNTINKSTSIKENSTMKANLIDGLWEVNYIMNTPKPLNELFPKGKPTITFDSAKKAIAGNSGCNNFNGKCSIEGNSIKIDEAMALTRKMCLDMTGEQIFLETLKKVNAYSVTHQGKTLHLIMGDIAVMRLERIQ